MVLIHELGHVFGLQHQSVFSVMNAHMPALWISSSFGLGITDATAVPSAIPALHHLFWALFIIRRTAVRSSRDAGCPS